MKIAPIIDPHARRPSPKPMQVDLRKTFMLGIVLWVIALIVCIVLNHANPTPTLHSYIIICCFGIAIGVVLLIWEFFDRTDYRRLGR